MTKDESLDNNAHNVLCFNITLHHNYAHKALCLNRISHQNIRPKVLGFNMNYTKRLHIKC